MDQMLDPQTTYRFSIGPWNISEGRDPYGPETRPTKDFAWKLEQVKKGGFGAGMFVELVAPRLWFSPTTVDGAYTSNDAKARQYAIDRSLQTIDIADALG